LFSMRAHAHEQTDSGRKGGREGGEGGKREGEGGGRERASKTH